MARVMATSEMRAETFVGTYRCTKCGATVALDAEDVQPVIDANLAIPDVSGRGARVQFVPPRTEPSPCCGRVATLWQVLS